MVKPLLNTNKRFIIDFSQNIFLNNRKDLFMTKITKASIDLGNDTIKAHINEENLAIPSVIAPSSALAKKHFTSDREETEYFKHFEDYMDASVSSPAVNTQNRIYVGQAAINSGETGRRFDVNSFSGKSADDLSVLLMLTTIAAWRVKQAYFNKENLLKSGDSWEHQTYNNSLKSTILSSLNVLNQLKQELVLLFTRITIEA